MRQSANSIFMFSWDNMPDKIKCQRQTLIALMGFPENGDMGHSPEKSSFTTANALKQVKLYHWTSQKHAYIILTPLNPTFIYQNWGLQGCTLFFLFLLKNKECGYSLELPRRGGSYEYPQSVFWAEIWKISEFFIWKFSFFFFFFLLGGKIFIILE